MRVILIFLLTLTAGTLLAQKQIYKIVWKGDSIGYLVATRTHSGGLTRIELTSESEFSFLLSFNMNTEYLSVFRDKKLLSSVSKSTLNDKERSLTKTKYMDNFYQVEVDGEVNRLDREIHETIATLYFQPPTAKEVFSERHGQFCRIEKVSETHYRLIKPDNRINNYHYTRGMCDEVQVELAMADVVLKRIM